MSLTYIALIEQGQRGGADDLLLKIEKLFKLKPNTLLKLRDSGNKDKVNLQEGEVKLKQRLKQKLN